MQREINSRKFVIISALLPQTILHNKTTNTNQKSKKHIYQSNISFSETENKVLINNKTKQPNKQYLYQTTI